MKSLFSIMALVGLIAIAPLASAQQLSKVSGKLSPRSVHGKAVHGYVEVNVPFGFHIYNPHYKGVGVPTVISLASGQGFHLVYIGNLKPGLLSGEVKFPIGLKIGKNVHGRKSIVIAVRFQQCNDKICLPPVTKDVRLTTFVK